MNTISVIVPLPIYSQQYIYEEYNKFNTYGVIYVNPSNDLHISSANNQWKQSFNDVRNFYNLDYQLNTPEGPVQIKIVNDPSNELQLISTKENEEKHLNCDEISSSNEQKRRGRPPKPIKVDPGDYDLHKLPIKKRIYKQLRLKNNESCRKTRRKLRGEIDALMEECNSLESTRKRLKKKYLVLKQLQKEFVNELMNINSK